MSKLNLAGVMVIAMCLGAMPPLRDAAAAGRGTSAAGGLSGVWLADAADRGDGVSWISAVWASRLTIAGDAFTISNFRGLSRDLTGTFSLDASGSGMIDLQVNEFVLDPNRKLKYPACTLPGVYRLEDDRLTICFGLGPDPARPAHLEAMENKQILLRLIRVKPGHNDFPKDVTVTVLDTTGKPARGVQLCGYLSNVTQPKPTRWRYSPDWGQTGDDGTLRIHYSDLREYQVVARDGKRKLTGMAAVSPASLQSAAVTIRLAPERLVEGTITCQGPAGRAKPPSWSNVYLLLAGRRVGMCPSSSGRFSFPLPPGSYTLQAYGTQRGHKFVPLTVPSGEGVVQMPPIELPPLRFVDGAGVRREAVKQGMTAPEIQDVVAWKGKPVRLGDLRGKVVLLNFWGYWCGPCIAEVPTLIELHERFNDKGLVIIGVHVDVNGEIDSAAKLNQSLAEIRKEYWGGKEIPFPVALVSGKLNHENRGPARQYGVFAYPTTIIIDRHGKVAGEFGAFGPKDIDKATAAAEKLLRAE